MVWARLIEFQDFFEICSNQLERCDSINKKSEEIFEEFDKNQFQIRSIQFDSTSGNHQLNFSIGYAPSLCELNVLQTELRK